MREYRYDSLDIVALIRPVGPKTRQGQYARYGQQKRWNYPFFVEDEDGN